MRVALPDERVRFDGAASVETTDVGVKAHRIALELADQYPLDTGLVQLMPSGVRLTFRTDATEVGLHCAPVRFQLAGRDPFVCSMDVHVDGEPVGNVTVEFGSLLTVNYATKDVNVEPGVPGVAMFANLPAGEKTVELWLPHTANVDLFALELPEGSSLQPAEADMRKRWVHHGSSISHCMEADGPSTSWPAFAAHQSGYHITNLGLAGQCHIDQFSARTIAGLEADRISLKLGINVVNADSMRERAFLPAVHGFLDTVRESHPETPILVISPIYCEAVEEMAGPTVPAESGKIAAHGTADSMERGALTLVKIRAILADVVAKRVARGDTNLAYLDGLELFGQSDAGDMPDGLHPNAAGYLRMGERFAALDFLN